MLVDTSSDHYDFAVPFLDAYFDASNTLFGDKDVFGQSTQVSEAGAPVPSAVTCVSPSSLHPAVKPAVIQDMSSNETAPFWNKSPSFTFAGMDKLFYNGTPNSGNDTSLYIQIPSSENEGGVCCGSEFWVSVAWDKILPKLFEMPAVLNGLLKQMNEQVDLREKAMQILGCADGSTDAGAKSDGPTDGNHNTSLTSTIVTTDPLGIQLDSAPFTSYNSATSTSSGPFFFSDIGSATFQDSSDSSVSTQTRPTTSNSSGVFSPMLGADPSIFSMQQQQKQNQNGNLTPGADLRAWNSSAAHLDFTQFKLPPMPAPAPGVDELIKQHLTQAYTESTKVANTNFEDTPSSSGITVFTARPDTIDPFLLAQPDVIHNEETLEYVWSRADSTLYKLESLQGQQAITESGSIHFIFPPRTMLLTHEKDGTIATPAYSNLHPHSNEWLKSQVCHRSCPYRAGTASLKRPKTVREHFRKCVYLDEKHPLKVLSALQLAVLEREANGQLPNRRRAKIIRLATDSANRLY